MIDLVIRGGTVIDGTGARRRRADVGIDAGLIVAVGHVVDSARRTIDASGLLVTPGFVDIHTHYDGQVVWDSTIAPSSLNGVTSIAMGNCGVGFAPARPDRHDWLIGLLEGVEDIPGTALSEGLTWDWETFPDYLDALDRRRYTVDLGTHVPHAALRAYVMGDRGADHTAVPDDAELSEMTRQCRDAIDAGALGFATSRTFLHRTRAGASIGTLTATSTELQGIASALREAGRGVIQMVSDAYQSPDPAFADAELDVITELARSSGRPLSFTVEQVDQAGDRYRYLLRRIREINATGVIVRGQVAPRPVGALVGLQTSMNPFLECPSYQAVAHLPLEQRARALADPTLKGAITAEFRQGTGRIKELTSKLGRTFRLTDPVDYEPSLSRSVASLAAAAGRDEIELLYDLVLEDDGHRLLYLTFFNYTDGNLDAVREMMTAPHTLFGLSDGGAHCGTICDASFPTTTLTLWGRDRRQGGLLPLEWLVHGYTQRNAAHVGWNDRGVLAPGYLADVNVVDFDELDLAPPVVVYDLPGGARRLIQTPRGYRYTCKSGHVTFQDGEETGALPGRLVRGPRQRPDTV
jgi:N-acyl-D-amino-acid deacylase